MFELITPLSYWILTILWTVILCLYLVKLRHLSKAGGAIAVLLTILALDAFRTLFESVYFGLYFNSQFGFLPAYIQKYLAQPELIIIPKVVNIIVGVLVLFLLIRRWIPREVKIKEKQIGQLAESEARFRTIFEQAAIGVALIETKTGRFLRINQCYCNLVGVSIEDMSNGKTWKDITHPDDFKQNQEYMEKLTAGKIKQYSMEKRYYHKNGQIIWVNLTVGPNWKKDEQPECHIAVVEDITERRRAEDALKESEAKYRTFFENSGDAMLIIRDYVFVDCNDAAVAMIGYANKEEILETHPSKLSPELQPDGKNSYDKAMEMMEIALTGRTHRFEWNHQRKNGEVFPVEVSLTAIPQDEHTELHTVWRDITERKRSEEENLNLERQVQHAQKLESLGVLAGGIAHDFNNILMAILGNADIALQDMSAHSPIRDNIREIEKAATRAAGLSKQMLAYSGKGRFVIEPIHINEFVEEMGHLLEVTISKKAVLKYNFAHDLPIFDGDATQIRQVIMNLITNASEAIGDKSGVVAISTGAMDCDRQYLDTCEMATHHSILDKALPEGLYVYIEVADTGCGMDKETQQKIFDPFFTTKFTGRGLGMAALLGIVRGHKGTVKIYSEPGKGTTFKVLFPISENTDEKRARPQANQVARADQPAGGFSGTVLIADDEESICAIGKLMLSRMGFDVLIAIDGRQAVEIFRQNADDIVCVLLDLTMPHLDGEQVFTEIRRMKPDIKVILSSGYNKQDATQRFAGKGLAGFIQKPYPSAKLTEIIRKIMND